MLKLKKYLKSQKNIYSSLKTKLNKSEFFNLSLLKDQRLETLPYSIRILLENSLRNNDEFVFTS